MHWTPLDCAGLLRVQPLVPPSCRTLGVAAGEPVSWAFASFASPSARSASLTNVVAVEDGAGLCGRGSSWRFARALRRGLGCARLCVGSHAGCGSGCRRPGFRTGGSPIGGGAGGPHENVEPSLSG